jgi:Toprim domain-containing protein
MGAVMERQMRGMSTLSYERLADLCDRKIGIHDGACPECGPSRRAATNRKRKVLRIWHDGGGFITYHCVRCGAHGWARADGASVVDHQKILELKREATEHENSYAEQQLAKAMTLRRHSKPPQNTVVETYLREARGYSGPLAPSVRFLPSFRKSYPAMIAAFAIADELEPGVLSIRDDQIRGVHLTFLKPDGSDKAGTERDKIMVGLSNGWPIVLAPANDMLGLIICEGIETGLSLYEATGCGVWAAGSAGRLPVLADKVPTYVDCISIAGEADEGRKGAVALAEHLHARGLYCELRFLGDEEAHAA